MTDHQVVIAGGGPTGLMLAGELALAGVDVAVVERRAGQDLVGMRAGGLHSRTLEVLDQRGIVDRFLAQGTLHRAAPFARSLLDLSDLPTRHNYFLGLWQTHIERTLAEWVEELRVSVLRGREVIDFTQQDAVEISLSDGRSLRARYLVGCDGGRSVIRKRAGIAFPGWDASRSFLIAEVDFAAEPAWGMRHEGKTFAGIGKVEDAARVVIGEAQVARGAATLQDLRAALIEVYGTDYGLRSARYVSRFSDATRQAAAYRSGRVLLAGDAAHVHSPMGGQGLNLGVQDAVNLGWKLAQVVHGQAPESLLDGYHRERHAVGARVLRNTMALGALESGDPRCEAMRDVVSELLTSNEARRQYCAMISGLDIHYDLGEGHPLLGRRMPDLELQTAEGPRRVFTLLHEARPVLLDFGANVETPLRRIDARHDGAWELPVIGAVAAPRAVMMRPDGYVGWVQSA